MAQFYKILKADPLGDPWQNPKYPDSPALQRYWCQVEGEEWDVSISKQVPNTVTPGESVYGDLAKTTSQKGTNYWTFKSQKVPDGVQRPATTLTQGAPQAQPTDMSATQPAWFAPWGNILIDLQKDMKLLKGDEPLEPTPEPAKAEEPSKGVEQVGGEPISEEDKQVLDGIFGGEDQPAPEVPEEK